MKNRAGFLLSFTILLIAVFFFSACKKRGDKSLGRIGVVVVPDSISLDNHERYIALHYFDSYNFEDTSSDNVENNLGKAFHKYAAFINQQPSLIACESAHSVVVKSTVNTNMERKVMQLFNQFFNQTDSPYYDTIIYRSALRAANHLNFDRKSVEKDFSLEGNSNNSKKNPPHKTSVVVYKSQIKIK